MIVLSDRWAVSPSYSGYEVSDTGLVRNIKTKHILTFNTKKGTHPYQRVHLCVKGKAKYVLVHRLVLEAFVGPCPVGYQTLHLDDNPKNTSDIINNIIDSNNINKLKNKLVPFDNSKDDKPYDEILSNIYYKHYVFNNYIFNDDTIKNIKNKICTSIEFPNNITYCLPSRMYLWSQYNYYDVKNNVNVSENVMLGQKWIIRNELLKIDIEPNYDISVYQNLNVNLKIQKLKDFWFYEYNAVLVDKNNNFLRYL
jgi:hypothetical protein